MKVKLLEIRDSLDEEGQSDWFVEDERGRIHKLSNVHILSLGELDVRSSDPAVRVEFKINYDALDELIPPLGEELPDTN